MAVSGCRGCMWLFNKLFMVVVMGWLSVATILLVLVLGWLFVVVSGSCGGVALGGCFWFLWLGACLWLWLFFCWDGCLCLAWLFVGVSGCCVGVAVFGCCVGGLFVAVWFL